MAASTPSRRSRFALPIALATLLTISLFVPLAGSVGGAGARWSPVHSIPSAHLAPTAARAAPATVGTVHPRGAGTSGSVAAGGRLYSTLLTSPTGIVADNQIAVDSATQIVYSVNRLAGTVTSFYAQNGTLQHTYTVSRTPLITPTALVIDTTDHRLYVSVTTSVPVGGYVLVLAESDLSLVANVSSLAGTSGYQPTFEVYDAATGQVFLENQTASVEVVNTTNNTAWVRLAPPCLYSCYAYGLVDINAYGHQYLIVPTGFPTVETVNVTTDNFAGPLPGRSGLTAGFAAYDSSADRLWVANTTSNNVEVYSLSTGAYIGSVVGPSFVQALAFDASTDMMFISVQNYTAGAAEQLYAYSALLGILDNTYANASASVNQAFTTLAVDHQGGIDWLVASGVYNSTTMEFTITTSTPYISPLRWISSFAAVQVGVAVDPTLGLYYEMAAAPDGIFAFNESTGAVQWFRNLDPWGGPYQGLALDPVQGYLYTVDTVNVTLVVFSAATGAFVKASPLGGLFFPNGLIDDPVNHLLYLFGFGIGGDGVRVFSTASNVNSVLGNIALPGSNPCQAAVDTVLKDLYLANCAKVGNVTVVSGSTFNVTKVIWQVGGLPYGLAVGGDGLLYVGSETGHNLTAINVTTGRSVANVPTPGLGANAIAAYGAHGWLYLVNVSYAGVAIVNSSSGTEIGTLPLPAASISVAVDAVHQTLIAPTYTTGVTMVATLVPLPIPPTGLALTSGNDSIAAGWTAATGSALAPITGYQMYTATASAGPFTVAATPTGTSASLTGLTDGSTYWVEVASVSAAGTSPRSAPQNTTPSGVPYPPTSLVVTANGSSSIRAAWGAPAQTDGAPVTNYTVWYATATSGPWSSLSAGTALSATLSHLSSSRTYFVEVVAYNHNGAGHASAQATATTSGAPSTSNSPFSGSTALLLLAVLLVIIVVVVVVAAVMMRRRRPPPPVQPYTGTTAPGAPMPTPPPMPPGPMPQPPGGGPPPGAV